MPHKVLFIFISISFGISFISTVAVNAEATSLAKQDQPMPVKSTKPAQSNKIVAAKKKNQASVRQATRHATKQATRQATKQHSKLIKRHTRQKPKLPIKRKVSSLTDILQDSTKEEESSQAEWVEGYSGNKAKYRKPQSLNYKDYKVRWVRDKESK